MRFEHTVVVPLPLSDARRLLDELERRVPVLPGLVVRVELAVIDSRSTSVHLRGELPAVGGMGSALLLETGMRLLRRYAEQVVAVARSRSAAASAQSGRSDPVPGTDAAAQKGDIRRDSYTFGNAPASPPLRLRDDPVVWAIGAVGVVMLLRGMRRKRS